MAAFADPRDEEIPALERMLAAGARLLAGTEGEDGRRRLGRVLATQAVIDEAGLERTHLYRAFPSPSKDLASHDLFLAGVLDHVLQREHVFDPSTTRSIGESVQIASPEDAFDATRRMAAREFEAMGPDGDRAEAFRTYVATWALAGDDVVVDSRLRELYRDGTDDLAALYESLLDAWDCQLIAPVTASDLALMLTCLLEGMLLRNRYDPASVPSDGSAYGSAVASIVAGLLLPKVGIESTVRQRFAQVKTRLDHDPGAMSDGSDDKLARAVRAKGTQLIQAAVAAGRDPRVVGVAELAEEAGCSTATIERLWGGTSLLLLDVFYRAIEQNARDDRHQPLAKELDELTEQVQSLALNPPSAASEVAQWYLPILGRMVYETAMFGANHRLLAGAALATIEFGSRDGSSHSLRSQVATRLGYRSVSARFEEVIDVGQQLGVLRDELGLSAAELGNLLPVTVLHQAVRRDATDPRHVAEIIYSTLVRGLVADVATLVPPRAATRRPRGGGPRPES